MKRSNEAELLDKIRALPADKIAEVEDFVEFLKYRSDNARLDAEASRLSEAAFQKVWDNPDDAEYDHL